MEIVRKDKARRFSEDDSFISFEYDTSDPDLNIARIEINGRIPAEGVMRNTKVKEIVYVEEGEGTITANGKMESIGKGDVIFYDKNEEVVWEGKLILISACTPAWTLDQHERLEK